MWPDTKDRMPPPKNSSPATGRNTPANRNSTIYAAKHAYVIMEKNMTPFLLGFCIIFSFYKLILNPLKIKIQIITAKTLQKPHGFKISKEKEV